MKLEDGIKEAYNKPKIGVIESQVKEAINVRGSWMYKLLLKPRVILMHPITWINLTKEMIGEEGLEAAKYKEDVRYDGIVIFKSLDLKLEEIIVF